MSIKGIRSVDFLITANGEGVINNNGSISVYNPSAEQIIDNHMFPKLRGLDPMRKVVKGNSDEKPRPISLADPDLAKAALIVSANCIRSHIFKNVSFGVQEVTRATVGDALASLHGLVRGYLITDGGANFARKSPLYLTDFECLDPQLSYNQGSKAGQRVQTSIFSHFNTGKDLVYRAKGSLSIEDLQFIPLENSLGRSSFSETISINEGQMLAQEITNFLVTLSGNHNAKADFVTQAIRLGTFARHGEAGILLNQDAIDVIVKEVIDMIASLFVRQGKGYLRVTKLVVDYNTTQPLRIEQNSDFAEEKGENMYAMYYSTAPLDENTFEKKMLDLKASDKERKDKKENKSKKGTKATKIDTSAEGTVGLTIINPISNEQAL